MHVRVSGLNVASNNHLCFWAQPGSANNQDVAFTWVCSHTLLDRVGWQWRCRVTLN